MACRAVCRAVLAAVVIVSVGAPPAGAKPVNDGFAAAAPVISMPFTDVRDTSGASVEPDEPSACGNPGATVWYRVSVTRDVQVAFSTSGSAFDTLLSVYEGSSMRSLQLVACNDDQPGSMQSRATAVLRPGRSYYVQAGGHGGASGRLTLSAEIVGRAVGNDDFDFAQPLDPIPFAEARDTAGASREFGEPAATCAPATETVWYRIVSPAARVLRVWTSGSNYDTVLALFRGSALDDLTEIACNDDTRQSVQSELVAVLDAGSTYYVQASSFQGAAGKLALQAELIDLPANDAVSSARQIDVPYSGVHTNYGATTEPGEGPPPELCPPIGATTWYRFTLDRAMPFVVSTLGSDFDTAVAVYTGPSEADLTFVGCADEFGVVEQSMTGFAAVPGETFWIQVGGRDGASGSYRLEVATGAAADAGPAGAGVLVGKTNQHAGARAATAKAGAGLQAVRRDGIGGEATGCVFAFALGPTCLLFPVPR